jgi:hypothetical protein
VDQKLLIAAKAATSEIPVGQKGRSRARTAETPALTQGLALIRFS